MKTLKINGYKITVDYATQGICVSERQTRDHIIASYSLSDECADMDIALENLVNDLKQDVVPDCLV